MEILNNIVARHKIIVPWKTSVFKIKIEECLVVLDGKVTIVEVEFIKICKNVGIKLFLIYKENHCAISG